MVADGGGVHVECVEHVDRGLVRLYGGGEERGADVVAGREQQRGILAAGGTEGFDGAGHLDGVGVDASVEVVDVQKGQVDLTGSGDLRCRADWSVHTGESGCGDDAERTPP